MSNRQKWIDHQFPTGIDPDWSANIYSRLEDIAYRLNHLVKNFSEEQLASRNEASWSVKEHIGHLSDLEQLWQNRFSQFKEQLPELIPADMGNKATEMASHNDCSIQELLSNFAEKRKALLSTYASLSEIALLHQAFHPRLKQLMRPVDLLFFIAEHDEHHLCSIKWMLKER